MAEPEKELEHQREHALSEMSFFLEEAADDDDYGEETKNDGTRS